MQGMAFLQDFAVVMIVAGLVTLIFHRLKQPVVLGYLVAGFLIGPFTPPYALVKDLNTIQTMADLGVLFLLFSLGLDFNLHKLQRVGGVALIVAAFEIAVMIWVGYELGTLFHWSPADSLFLGLMLALTSTMIVIKGLRDHGALGERYAELISGVCLFDDMFVLSLLVLLPGLAQTGTLSAHTLVESIGGLLIFLVAAAIVGLLAIPALIRYVSRFKSDEMLLITVLGLCFGVALLAVRLGFSAALGAFLVGAVAAESAQAGRIIRLTAPIRDMFCAVFFVAIGMMIDPRHVWAYLVPVAVIVAVYLVAKVGACTIGSFLVGYGPKDAVRVGTNMAQVGEFGFILATMGISLGLAGSHLYPIIVAVATMNALVRPYLVDNSDRLTAGLARLVPRTLKMPVWLYSRWVMELREAPPRNPAMKYVRSLVWQLTLNAVLIAGTFIIAALVARNAPAGLPALPEAAGGVRTVCWTGAVLLTLPIYIVSVRKLQALAMMLAEISVSAPADGRRLTLIRAILTNTIFLAGVAALALLTLLLSSAILPPIHVLWGLLIAIVLVLVVFGRSFNNLYSRAKFALIATWSQPAPAHDPEAGPALPRDAAIETITLAADTVAVGQRIRELDLRATCGVSIMAVERGGKTLVNPRPDERLQAGDSLLLLGDRVHLAAARDRLTRPSHGG